MNSFNKTNDFKVLVEIYESKHKFVINFCPKNWSKLKKSIEYRINRMIGEKIDFKYHLFKVFDESTKTFVVLDQMVYNYFRRLPEMYVLVVNTEDIKDIEVIKRKPNDSELKKWKNTKSYSEMIVSEMNGLNLLNGQKIRRIEELLAKTVSKLVNESNFNWFNVSQEMISYGYKGFNVKRCHKEFGQLVDKYLGYLGKSDTDLELDSNLKLFKCLNGIDLHQLLQISTKKPKKGRPIKHKIKA